MKLDGLSFMCGGITTLVITILILTLYGVR